VCVWGGGVEEGSRGVRRWQTAGAAAAAAAAGGGGGTAAGGAVPWDLTL
jgi:hypothetical protein